MKKQLKKMVRVLQHIQTFFSRKVFKKETSSSDPEDNQQGDQEASQTNKNHHSGTYVPFAEDKDARKNEDVATEAYLGTLCTGAKSAGVKGIETPEHFLSQAKGMLSSLKANASETASNELNVVSAQLESKKTEQGTFSASEKEKGFSAQLKQDAALETVKAKADLDETCIENHQLKQQDEAAGKHLDSMINKYGEIVEKDVFDKYPYALITTVGVTDLGLTTLAFMGLDMEPGLAAALAIGTSMSMLLSSHGLAEAIMKKATLSTVFWALVSCSTLVVIIASRVVGKDEYYLLTGSLLVVFFSAATGVIYRYATRKNVLEAKAAKKATESALKENTKSISEKANSIPVITENTTSKAGQMTAEYKSQLDLEVNDLGNKKAYWEQEKQAISDYYCGKEKEFNGAINEAFKEGKASRYTPPKSSVLSTLGMIVLLLVSSSLFTGCKGVADRYGIALPVDKSGSMLELEEKADEICEYVFSIASLNESQARQRSVDVFLYTVGVSNVPEKITVSLSLSDPFAVRKTESRKKEIQQFKADLIAALKSILSAAPTGKQTNLHRNIAHIAQALGKREFNHKYILVLSDGIEEGGAVAFPDYLHADSLRSSREEVIAKLLEDTPLDLTGVEMTMLAKSRVPSHSLNCQQSGKHTSECILGNDPFAYESALTFVDLWQRSGAKQVHLMRNF